MILSYLQATTIVLLAGILVVGILSLSGNSPVSLMVASTPQSEQFGMLGHVEYKVMDSSGNIVQYKQGDNLVTNDGKDCVAQKMFGIVGSCNYVYSGDEFNYIGIGNGTSTAVDITDKTLADADGNDQRGTCASTSVGGEMARLQVTATHTPATESTGAIVTLDTYENPFTFDASNATTVIDSGIFNDEYWFTPNVEYDSYTRCPVGSYQGVDDDWSMFARQLAKGADGIAVNDGDTLTIKWVITIG